MEEKPADQAKPPSPPLALWILHWMVDRQRSAWLRIGYNHPISHIQQAQVEELFYQNAPKV